MRCEGLGQEVEEVMPLPSTVYEPACVTVSLEIMIIGLVEPCNILFIAAHENDRSRTCSLSLGGCGALAASF